MNIAAYAAARKCPANHMRYALMLLHAPPPAQRPKAGAVQIWKGRASASDLAKAYTRVSRSLRQPQRRLNACDRRTPCAALDGPAGPLYIPGGLETIYARRNFVRQRSHWCHMQSKGAVSLRVSLKRIEERKYDENDANAQPPSHYLFGEGRRVVLFCFSRCSAS